MDTMVYDKDWGFTQYAENIMDDVKSEFESYYSREMLEEALDKFLRAPKSTRIFLQNELEEMLKKSGIKNYDIHSPESVRELLKTIPTAEDLYKAVFHKLYEISKTFKNSRDYMKRLVNRLADDEFKNDSTKLAIVKQFIKYTDYNTKPVIEYVTSEVGKNMSDEEKLEYTLKNITDDIFENDEGEEKTSLTDNELLKIECRVLLTKFEEELNDISCYDEVKSILTELSAEECPKIFSERIEEIKELILGKKNFIKVGNESIIFPVSECRKEYFGLLLNLPGIEQIKIKDNKKVKACFKTADRYNPEFLMPDKIKFITEKYDLYIAGTEYEEGFVELLNDIGDKLLSNISKEKQKIFNKANNDRKKDAKKSIKKSYDRKLLKLAESLENGNFYTNGKTKNDLYMFAFAFNMTSSINSEFGICDEERDIDKNLFHDYYNHNLLNYIEQSSDYEAEPTGAGINIKNFVEVIYLYYLSLDNLTPKEKINRAEKCIEECKKKSKSTDKEKTQTMNRTNMYRNNYSTVIKLSEEELVDYICENFYFDENNNSVSAIMYASEEITAYENCKMILSEIDYAEGDISELRYECGIEDIEEELKMLGIEDEKFLHLLSNMNQMLDNKAEFFEDENFDKKKIKRTDIITLAYYYKILESADEFEEIRNFSEIYEDFCDYVNPVLTESRYQPISTKNIFDMFILLNLYRLSGDTPIAF